MLTHTHTQTISRILPFQLPFKDTYWREKSSPKNGVTHSVHPVALGYPLHSAALASVPYGTVLVRVRSSGIITVQNPLTPFSWRSLSFPQIQTRPNRLHTHTHPPKRLAHPRSLIPLLSTLTSRATHAHPTSPRSTGFCAIWGCISSSSSSLSYAGRFCATRSCVYDRLPSKQLQHKAEDRVLNLPPRAFRRR